jgi:hypothetical protein
MFLGAVHPPGGGVITNWYHHRAVRDGNRIYDKMTGEDGMTIEHYQLLFECWDELVITTVEDE